MARFYLWICNKINLEAEKRLLLERANKKLLKSVGDLSKTKKHQT